MNLLITISDIFVMANVGLLVGLIVPLLILLFFAKYRGIWASIIVSKPAFSSSENILSVFSRTTSRDAIRLTPRCLSLSSRVKLVMFSSSASLFHA